MKRFHSYPKLSEVQRTTGHVYLKGSDNKWHPRGRVLMARQLGRPLEDCEKVFHINGKPSDDTEDNLVAIRFSGTRYRIQSSRPIFIPNIIIPKLKLTK